MTTSNGDIDGQNGKYSYTSIETKTKVVFKWLFDKTSLINIKGKILKQDLVKNVFQGTKLTWGKYTNFPVTHLMKQRI